MGFRQAACMALAFGACTGASAALVELSGQQTQISNSQLMTFDFNGLSPSAGGGATFSMKVLGDYDLASEVLPSVSIDGNTVATDIGPGLGNVTLLSQSLYYSEWTYSLAISELDLAGYLADGMLSIAVQIGPNSGVFVPGTQTGYAEDPYVQVGFSYVDSAVPEPATAALLLAGLLGAGAVRRRQGVTASR